MKHSVRCLAALAGAGLWLVLSSMVSGSTASTSRDVLFPVPKRLENGVPFRDRFGCGECLQGPYILDTDEKGATPKDLTELSVRLDSATDQDLAIVILTEYVVRDGEVRWRDEWEVCIEDRDRGGNLGRELCEIKPESLLGKIRGRPIYIFAVNIDPRPHEFIFTATWKPAVPPICTKEPCYSLTSNKAELMTFEANSFRFSPLGQQPHRLFRFDVPVGAMVLALRVKANDPQANVDAFLGWTAINPEDKVEDKVNIMLVSSLGEETMILPQPAGGRYWLAVQNRTDKPQIVEVIVTVVMDLRELKPGTSETGQIGSQAGLLPLLGQYLRSAAWTLAPTQYKLSLKSEDLTGVIGLQIALRSAGGLNLYLRSGQAIEVRDGQIVADLSLVGPATEKTAILSGTLLKPGDIYLVVAGSGALPQNYTLEVTLLKPGGLESQIIRIPLEPVWVQLRDNR